MSILFTGGPILTMEPGPRPEALLVRDGTLAALGSLAELSALDPHAQPYDLAGQTLMPAFLDGHSHLTALAATFGLCNLSACGSLRELETVLVHYAQEHPTGWVLGFGYDHNILAERAHPDRRMMDALFPDRPALVTHASGHMGVANTAALELAGLGPHSPDPDGGKIGREADGRTPSGYLEENAFFALSKLVPPPSAEQMSAQLTQAQDLYLSQGITLVQDGKTGPGEYALLSHAPLKVEVVCYADLKTAPELIHATATETLSVGGYKIFLDGSPQGRTAWMLEPYAKGDGSYRGYPAMEDEAVTDLLIRARKENAQVLAHCNGDAAAAQYIRCWRWAMRADPGHPDLRPVMIHAQLVRKEQLAEMKSLGIMPSFFAAHVRYWGDVHMENFGPHRAASISPLAWAKQLGLPFTLHQDAPVLPPNMLESISIAATRRTRSGVLLGPEQIIPVEEALLATTRHAAWQYHMEDRRGTLAPGKVADLIVLDADPTSLPPDQVEHIRVTETFRSGKSVWRR